MALKKYFKIVLLVPADEGYEGTVEVGCVVVDGVFRNDRIVDEFELVEREENS